MVSSIYIGLISGTSMDAIDCALVDFSEGSPVQLDFINTEIPDDLRQKLLALCEDHNAQVPLLGEADVEFARELAKAVHRILDINNLKPSQIAAIGSHGQTIRHQPQGNPPFTLQIGDPNILAELTGISTVADFRRRDMAAGGQGAPLVPAFHRGIFSSADHDRVILNIGGMANITILKKLGGITAFDTGPGNVLMDYWIQTHQGHPYDHEGSWARSGSTNDALLAALLNEPYFALPAPKSTGRELFNKAWLESKLAGCTDLSENDVQTTLLFLTLESIATAITSELDTGEIIVCGGGARNTYLMETLSSNFTGFDVMPSSRLGIMEDSMEAIAFAWMAHKTMHEKSIDFTEITGSSHPVIAGGVYYAGKK
ncbi:MAG: anhydro-N-acetylmuramic acid kinase [Gammaproteobacteria bacterium]|nr:anhydro-N-acetylmuramic acid kinase [Gammaproteobacteria bacterium]